MHKLAILVASVTLFGAGAASLNAANIQYTMIPESHPCLYFQDHVYEVCIAYVFWDAHVALQPYYKYVKSDSLFSGAKNFFPKRYKGSAPAQIYMMAHIAKWPRGTNKVEGPSIRIIDANASLKCNRAVLITEESWVVRNPDVTKPLYTEDHKVHTVVLRRVPGEIFVFEGKSLHAWDVYQIYSGKRNLPTC